MGKLWKRSKRSKKPSGAQSAPVAASSDSDISLLSEESDWEAERAALRANLAAATSGSAAAPADPFEHASLWAEVDRDELERMALNVARNAVPPAPAGEGAAADAAARLNMAAAVAERAEEHDSTDPLGRGRIDTRLLTLAKGDSSAALKQRYSRVSGGGLLDSTGRRPWASGRAGEEAGGGGEAPPALRARVLPGSEQFDPQLYLGTIHADTTLPDLVRGLAALRSQLSEHTGQLKALVKENFDRFISSSTLPAAARNIPQQLHKQVPAQQAAISSKVAFKVQMPLTVATGPDHIVLRVADPLTSVQWYTNTLGLEPVRVDEFKAGKVPFPSARVSPTFLIDFFKQQSCDPPEGADLPSAGSIARRNTGFDHFCLVVQSDDIEAVRQQLAAAGIQAEPQFDGAVVKRFGAQGNASSIYIRDPDSYVVELRTYGHRQEATAEPADPTAAGKPLNESKCDEGSGI